MNSFFFKVSRAAINSRFFLCRPVRESFFGLTFFPRGRPFFFNAPRSRRLFFPFYRAVPRDTQSSPRRIDSSPAVRVPFATQNTSFFFIRHYLPTHQGPCLPVLSSTPANLPLFLEGLFWHVVVPIRSLARALSIFPPPFMDKIPPPPSPRRSSPVLQPRMVFPSSLNNLALFCVAVGPR